MDATNTLRYRIIKNVMAQHDEKDAVLAIINLWERLAIIPGAMDESQE
jgi:hypothetical protein